MNKNNEINLPQTLKKIFDILNKHEVFFWLDGGSLLKGLRDRTILNSSDIDLGTLSDNTKNIFFALKELSADGYKYNFNGGFPMLEDLVTIVLPNKVNEISHVDIYIYNKEAEFFFRRSYHKPLANSKFRYLYYLTKKIILIIKSKSNFENNKLRLFFFINPTIRLCKILFSIYEYFGVTTWFVIPLKYFKDFRKIELYKMSFNIPYLYKEYLAYRYGNDWMKPKMRSKWFQEWRKNSKILKNRKLRSNLKTKKYWIIL